jgi:hypothetical protein
MGIKTFIAVLLVSIFMISCAPATQCPYMRNPGPPPPEVKKRAQDAFFALGPSGIRGTLKVEANGEYACDQFAVEDINFEYTLYVSTLADQAMLKEYVTKVTQSAKDSLQGWNFGYVKVRFVTGETCGWDELRNACAPIQPLTNP